MEIKTKYNIGDIVYQIDVENDTLELNKCKIEAVYISNVNNNTIQICYELEHDCDYKLETDLYTKEEIEEMVKEFLKENHKQ